MDEQRKEHIAYEYLCHLEEAKQWVVVLYPPKTPPPSSPSIAVLTLCLNMSRGIDGTIDSDRLHWIITLSHYDRIIHL